MDKNKAHNQTRLDIMDAFWCLYEQQRIEKITIKALMQQAGYHRATFYEYFHDVYDVLEQWEEQLVPDVDALPRMMKNQANPLDAFIKLYETNGRYYGHLLGERGDPAFAKRVKARLKLGLLAQIPSEFHTTRLDYQLEFVLSITLHMLDYWFTHQENLSQEELITMMLELMDTPAIHALEALRSQKTLP
ncbi:MAG: TetR/AcrR family transcriptional regulator [Erysipelotrichaceae bacterium]